MKTRSFYRFAVPAALIAGVLALSGCSSSDVASGNGDTKKAESEEGPLQKYMSVMWDSDQCSEEGQAKIHAKTEELVAACMTKEGFEYKPNVQTGGMEASGSDGESPWSGMGTLKYAETYGFGTIDWPGKDEMTDQQSSQESYVDPNQKYLESLSASEVEAYNETLWGADFGRGPIDDDEPYEYDWTKSGCQGAAQHETQPTGADAYDDPEFKDLFARMDEMYSETSNDGETPAANAEQAKLDRRWIDCMAESGYDYTDTLQPANEFNDEWNEIQNAAFDSETGAYKEPSKADQKNQEELTKKLQEREIKVAVIDAKCQEKLNYAKEAKRISHELEQKFLDENKVQLEAMLAKYGTKKQSK